MGKIMISNKELMKLRTSVMMNLYLFMSLMVLTVLMFGLTENYDWFLLTGVCMFFIILDSNLLTDIKLKYYILNKEKLQWERVGLK